MKHGLWPWMRGKLGRRELPEPTRFGPGAVAQDGLYGAVQLGERARWIADHHEVLPPTDSDDLLQRLGRYETALNAAFNTTRKMLRDNRALEPAAEWLVDNFYLIMEQIKEVRTGLPRAYRRKLPTVAVGGERVPRSLLLMRELAGHADSSVRLSDVHHFVQGFQVSQNLTLGELWSIPLMLRFALIERLQPQVDAIVARMVDAATAANWSDRLHEVARKNPEDLIVAVADMAQSGVRLTPAFAVEFQRLMRDGDASLELGTVWLDQQLRNHRMSVADALEQQGREQAAAQVSLSNCVATIRTIRRSDWSLFVESVSVVDEILRQDPAGVYARMDFATRDRYRHVLEDRTDRSGLAEWEVARRLVERAAAGTVGNGDVRQRHVGYWLVGHGRLEFMHELGIHRPFRERFAGWLRQHPSMPYGSAIVGLTCVFALATIPAIRQFGHWHAGLMIAAVLIAMSHASVAIVNWLVTIWVAPQMLPRMAFKNGIPDSARSLVAVPCLLSSESEIAELVSALEIRNIVNRDRNLYFALLADFTDAPQRVMDADAGLLKTALDAIETLNQEHEVVGSTRFFLFIRDRQWNEREGAWMGKERKRGKLSELNRFLRDKPCDSLHLVNGNADQLREVKYVITLDADTELPPQSAIRLIATMAHPLNRPLIDGRGHRVTAGYGILQPRISVEASRDVASRFAQLYSDDVGLDPYTRVVSDVYQDLFDEASFVGKGIYDVDALTATTGRRFPENLILSHDLLEGSYARTGLVSDVELFERHPDRYTAALRRRHRWIRGDWQVMPWLLPWVPGPHHRWVRNGLSGHQRTKILDNLRRSLVPPALLLILLNGWLLSLRPLFWTVAAVGVLYASPLLISIRHFASRHPRMSWKVHFRLNREGMMRRLEQAALVLVMLPCEAKVHLDAIGRSLWRLWVSRQRRLEWVPSSEVARTSRRGLLDHWRLLWVGPAVAVATAVLIGVFGRGLLTQLIAAPILLVWFFSPWIAWLISQPRLSGIEEPLDASQRDFLGVMARRTWAFFERFVNAQDNHLPPDNHQADAETPIAQRTSPTNIGLYLVSALSAYDFGYITGTQLFARIEDTVATLEKLERYQGHFLNWYHTRTLEPLLPRYVSSVDSGNLLACLLIVARGLEMLEDDPLLPAQVWRGLHDEWRRFRLDAGESFPGRGGGVPDVARIDAILTNPPDGSVRLASRLERLAELERCLQSLSQAFALPAVAAGLLVTLAEHVRDARQEIAASALWLEHEAAAESSAYPPVPAFLESGESWRAVELAPSRVAEADARLEPRLQQAIERAAAVAKTRRERAEALAERCRALCNVEYEFLCLPHQPILSIGYNVDQHALDEGGYDLLASEARLGSFVGIAQGRLPRRNWFALGRLLTLADGRPALVSWSGSMFEYLMPLLLMPSFDNTLVTRTCRTVVERQISYGRERGVPWGISEAAYNTRDASLVYQYRAFGVPGLGLKRDLADDLVVAPYASAMALLLRPAAACNNLRRLAALGAADELGFFDSVDYTPARIPEDKDFAIVRSHMAHHQGMLLAALSGALNGKPLQRRFLGEPMFRANRLLLQEKVPAALLIDKATLSADDFPELKRPPETRPRVIEQLDTSVPQLQLLSNGRYHVAISQTGGGFSQWHGLAVNHWREDPVCDAAGIFCYVQDLDQGLLWSNTWQPTGSGGERYEVIFSQANAEYRRRDHDIEVHTRVAVSAEDDLELRRITVTNHDSKRRRLALTSYVEWVLTRRSDELAHPVFNRMFVETAQLPESQAIIARRRPRAPDENPPSFFHMMVVPESEASGFSFETRRDVFIGRQGSLASPVGLQAGAELGNGVGPVLDPIAAVRRELVLEPGQSITVDMITGAAATAEAVAGLAALYAEGRFDDRVFGGAWTREQVLGHQLGLGPGDRQLFARLAGSVVYCDPEFRQVGTQATPSGNQAALWKYGISGDLPIVLLRVHSVGELPLVRQLLMAHTYWRTRGIQADLVIWTEGNSGYRQELRDRIMGLVSSGVDSPALDQPGGVFVRNGELLAAEDRTLLTRTARAIFDGRRGSLRGQLARESAAEALPEPLKAVPATQPAQGRAAPALEHLQFFNGTGGFSADGSEYVIRLPWGRNTPRPWVNVLANENFGSVISERGSAYTFADNAHEYRLTPWHNDPVLDSGGEAFYLRDDKQLTYWSPTPWPVRGGAAYTVRHGFGYSRFHTLQRGIESELCEFVAADAPLKLVVLHLRNRSDRRRQISVFGYAEWVLGDHRARSAPHIQTQAGLRGRVVLANNGFNNDFANKYAAFAASGASSATGDRREFIGRNGSLAHPAAMRREQLQGSFGDGLDPCAALHKALVLAPGEEQEVVFVLASADDAAQATALCGEYASAERAARELAAVKARWRHLLQTTRVETPDAAFNVLINGWLTYQVIASRLWARSGFYQSGGAYGFRDQLQDSVSLLDVDPGFARAQILRAAAHQFVEGDVQHWWHPPKDRGVRTRISDDYLWLPWAVARYVQVSGDREILDQTAAYLGGRQLGPEEESWYDVAEQQGKGIIYEHCKRAIMHGMHFGEHGLPLIGSGDWNDGMNRLGINGKGESVWLGFFLIDVLREFAPLAAAHGDKAFSRRCMDEAAALALRIEDVAWDGAWYRRAWSDDGQVVGSATNAECRIDSLPQSWATLSGTGSPERRSEALQSALGHLLHKEEQVVQLFDPPFDHGVLEPGYIKGYVPGTRENGGQYTHAAVWLGIACVAGGKRGDAWDILNAINPVKHALDEAGVARYQIEPYVLAADVYWARMHRGRGGWSWYTGSAGWLRRFMLEWLLGFEIKAGVLCLRPCMDPGWDGYQLIHHFGNSIYEISVVRKAADGDRTGLSLDGKPVAGDSIVLVDDGHAHRLELVQPAEQV